MLGAHVALECLNSKGEVLWSQKTEKLLEQSLLCGLLAM